MSEFAAWIKEIFLGILAWLLELVGVVLEWLLDALIWVLTKAWELLLEGLAALLEAIPVPSFMQQADSFWGGIPGSIVYFFQFFAVAEGMAMITTALALRFLLRRIPLIG